MPTTPAPLAAARTLAPEIAARGDEIEAGRRLPPDLAASFAKAGLFGVCVPARYGGGEGAAMHLLARAVALPLDLPVAVTAPPPEHMRAALAVCGWDAEFITVI